MTKRHIVLNPNFILRTDNRNTTDNFYFSTDSRLTGENDTFVALEGEKFDGFNFLEDVLLKNPPAVVYRYNDDRLSAVCAYAEKFPKTLFIGVQDTVGYLQNIAHQHISEWLKLGPKRKIVGITGSNGKTTHKEMLFHLLNAVIPGKVVCTRGNLNNHIGVPLTLLRVTNDHDIAIVEMGSNHPGEILSLCHIAIPNAGIITNIGHAHVEFFESQENIFTEKSALYDSVLTNSNGEGPFVVCTDDQYLKNLAESSGLITFGEHSGEILVSCDKNSIELSLENKKTILQNAQIMGNHNFKNLACCYILAKVFFPNEKDTLLQAAQSFKPLNNRSTWIQKTGKKIFLDAYNANPSSMRASLTSFASFCDSERISQDDCFYVLGDMNELGEQAPKLHEEIGALLNELKVKNVAFIGRYHSFYQKGFLGTAKVFEQKQDFIPEWNGLFSQYKFFFIKASRSLQLESLMDIS